MSNPNPTSGGPPLRALAMVLIALAIVFAGLGAMSLSGSDSSASDGAGSETPAATSSAAPVRTSAPAASSAAETPAPVTTTAETTTAETTTAETTATTAPETTPPPVAPSAPAVDRAVPVRVLNNSLVAGLAARTAGELGASGWSNVATGNYAGGTIPKTTVYYGNSPGERAAAEAVAAELGAVAEPRFPGIAGADPGVIVIVTGN